MKKPLFSGACTALVTPFLDNEVNYPLLEILVQRQIEAGIKAIVISGTTGESPVLSENEKLEMFRRAKNTAAGRCLIIAGTGSNNTAHAIDQSIKAEKVGADALLVVSPYYNKATPDGLIKHFTAIACSVQIPVILYNVPGRTGVDIPVSVYQQLSRVPNIVGVKEAGTDLTKITKIRNACGLEFSIWSGNDDLTVPVMALGGQGVISVSSNICPLEVSAMTRAALDGDFDTAAALQCQMQTLNELLFCEVNPVPVKFAMKCIGFDCGSCRLPLSELTAVNQKKLETYFG